MTLLQILFLTVLIIASVYTTLLNPTIIPIHLTSSMDFELPITIVLLCTFLVGIIIASLINFFAHSKARITLRRKYRKKEDLHETYIKGLEFYISGQQKRAVPLLEKVLRNDSSKVLPLTLLGNVRRSDQDYEEAINFHQKAKALAPANKFILKNLEEDYSSVKNLDLQKEVVKELVHVENDNLNNLKRLRDLHVKSENWNDTIEVQNKLISKIMDPDKSKEERRKSSIFYYESAIEAFDNESFKVAIRKLKSSIQEDSNFTASHILLGESYLKLGKERKALNVWNRGYKVTDDPLFLKRIDKLYIDQDRPRDVIKLYKDAINNKTKNMPLLHFLLGEAHIRFEEFDDALSEFQKAYACSPDSIALNLLIGKIYEKKNNFQSASSEYQKAFQKELSSVLKFTCGSCGLQVSKWVGRCPKCKEWDIKSFDINKSAQKLLD